MGPIALGEADRLTVRAFFGLPLPRSQRSALEPYVVACAAAAPAFRWTPGANLHLTVRFLGQVDAALAEGVAAALEGDGLSGFELQLGRLGAFKRGRMARVVWIGLQSDTGSAAALAARVEDRCRQAGLEPDERPFTAHLTLARARAREGAPLPDLPEPPALPAWRADELVLYRSHLGRGGSVYEPLRAIRLG